MDATVANRRSVELSGGRRGRSSGRSSDQRGRPRAGILVFYTTARAIGRSLDVAPWTVCSCAGCGLGWSTWTRPVRPLASRRPDTADDPDPKSPAVAGRGTGPERAIAAGPGPRPTRRVARRAGPGQSAWADRGSGSMEGHVTEEHVVEVRTRFGLVSGVGRRRSLRGVIDEPGGEPGARRSICRPSLRLVRIQVGLADRQSRDDAAEQVRRDHQVTGGHRDQLRHPMPPTPPG